MQYDPIKRSLGKVFNSSPFLRMLFYRLLDLLLLRSWHIRKELRTWAAERKAEPVSMLDAGSGFGQYVYGVARNYAQWQILGVDVKEEQINDCNHFFASIGKKNVRFELADLTKIDWEQEFDLILCVDVMEHIEEDLLVLGNFYRALKPGGMLLISTPSDQGGSDVHHHHESEGPVGFIDEHVRDGYGVEDLKTKFAKAGFESSHIRFQYGLPGRIAWKLSMKYPILLLNHSKLFFILLPFYYLIVFPICLVLNLFDLNFKHASGTGLIAKAWKKS